MMRNKLACEATPWIVDICTHCRSTKQVKATVIKRVMPCLGSNVYGIIFRVHYIACLGAILQKYFKNSFKKNLQYRHNFRYQIPSTRHAWLDDILTVIFKWFCHMPYQKIKLKSSHWKCYGRQLPQICSICHNHNPFFPHAWLITWFEIRVTWQAPLVEQELPILSSSPVFIMLSFLYWPFQCLIFFDIRLMVTLFQSSNFLLRKVWTFTLINY